LGCERQEAIDILIKDKIRIYDGFMTLEATVDSARVPNLNDTNPVANTQNIIFRSRRASIRPEIR
jgi:hypothetical protein